MKRDIDLVRRLLLRLEENAEFGPIFSSEFQVDGFSEAEVGYNLKLMAAGGLIDAQDTTAHDSLCDECLIAGITWYGHDFLDIVRNDGVWSSVREKIKPFGSVSFEVIKSVAVGLVSSKLGI